MWVKTSRQISPHLAERFEIRFNQFCLCTKCRYLVSSKENSRIDSRLLDNVASSILRSLLKGSDVVWDALTKGLDELLLKRRKYRML